MNGRDEGEEREVRETGISIVVAGSEESLSFKTQKRPQLNDFEEQVAWNSLCVRMCVCDFFFHLHVCVLFQNVHVLLPKLF